MRILLIAILAAFAAGATLFVALVPPFEAPDEEHHLDYVNFVASTGGFPDQYDPARNVRIQGHQHPLYYALAALPVRLFKEPPRVAVEARRNPRHRWNGGTEYQVPLYAPGPGGPFAGPSDRAWFYGLRLLSVALNVVNLALVWGIARLFFGPSPWALVPVLLAATLPQYLFLAATINNDHAVNLCASAALFFALRLHDAPASRRDALGLGLSFGLGLLAKKTILFMSPATALLLAWLWRRHPPLRRQIVLNSVMAVIVAALVSGGWFARNVALYGELTGGVMEKRTLTFLVREKPFGSAYFVTTFPRLLLESFVGRLGTLNVALAAPVFWAYGAIAAAAGLGLLGGLVRGRRGARRTFAVLYVLFALLGVVYYNFSYDQPQGRYFFPCLALLGVLTTWGLRAVVERFRSAAVRRGAVVVLVAAVLLADVHAALRVRAFYAGEAGRPTAAHAARTRAAVSTRRTRGPRPTTPQPAARARATSSAVKPPSGPTASATSPPGLVPSSSPAGCAISRTAGTCSPRT